MTTVFLLCAGDGQRWDNYLGVPKQLISFGGERILDRAARLIANTEAAKIWCVTRDEHIRLPQCETYQVAGSDSLAETILLTMPLWSDRNVFLLGDVFFSEGAVKRIFACSWDLGFAGRPWPSPLVKCGHGELFSFTFNSAGTSLAKGLLVSALDHKRIGVPANLWSLYQLAAGLPFGSSRWLPKLLMLIDDYTNDIDTPADFARRGVLYETVSLARQLAVAPREVTRHS